MKIELSSKNYIIASLNEKISLLTKKTNQLPVGTKILAGVKGFKEELQNQIFIVADDKCLVNIDTGKRYTSTDTECEFEIVDLSVTTKPVKFPEKFLE